MCFVRKETEAQKRNVTELGLESRPSDLETSVV